MNNFEDIKNKIKDKGYITGTQICIDLCDLKKIKEFLELLKKDPTIHKVEYTNEYIAPYKTKQLYFYNPNIKKRVVRKVKKNPAPKTQKNKGNK